MLLVNTLLIQLFTTVMMKVWAENLYGINQIQENFSGCPTQNFCRNRNCCFGSQKKTTGVCLPFLLPFHTMRSHLLCAALLLVAVFLFTVHAAELKKGGNKGSSQQPDFYSLSLQYPGFVAYCFITLVE